VRSQPSAISGDAAETESGQERAVDGSGTTPESFDESAIDPDGFDYRIAVRRLRDANNSAGLHLPSIKARVPWNPAFMNPEDMADEGIGEGDKADYDEVGVSTNWLTSTDPSARETINASPG